MGQPPQGVEVESEAFMANPLVLVAPPERLLVGVQSIGIRRLAKEVFVMRELGPGTRQATATERFFSERGVADPYGIWPATRPSNRR